MRILFYRYGSICEPDIITAFSSFGITVIEEKTEIYDKTFSDSARIKLVNELLLRHSPAFVFSINFFPAIAEVCHIHNIIYICWTVDSPMILLFTKPVQYPTNRIFLFDREQYLRIHPFNPNYIYYLPLAAAVDRFDFAVQSITEEDIYAYSSDISFVGSLYSEKNPLKDLTDLSSYAKGCIDGIIESSLQVYGYNFMEEAISDTLVSELKKIIPDFTTPFPLLTDIYKYAIAHQYIGAQAAETERIRTLNKLAERFPVRLYTFSNTPSLHGVQIHDAIESLYGMPKVFYLSKINLNMTIKPIQSGLPLRVFDILGSGGFLMTNYQAELTDYFEIGKDLEAYSSLDELIDKCTYYLQHEEERKQIARNGYETVKQFHRYPHRIAEMLHTITP